MKKIFVTLLAVLAVSVSMSAGDSKFNKDVDLTFGNDFFVVQPISYIGYGYHLPFDGMSDAQKSAFNSEFFVNVMELGIRPFGNGLIALGVDYGFDSYRLDKKNLWDAESGGSVWKHPIDLSPYKEIKRSVLRVHTLAIPLSFELQAGKCAFRVGAAGEYNLPAVVKSKCINKDDVATKIKVKGINTVQFNYSLFGAISYGGFGVFVRYRPSYQFEEGKGPHFKSLSIGAVIGLGM